MLQGDSIKALSFQPKNKLSPSLCFQVFAHVKIRKNEKRFCDKELDRY